MSSDPSRPDSPIPDLDLEVGDWSGSEKDLVSRPVETVVTTVSAGLLARSFSLPDQSPTLRSSSGIGESGLLGSEDMA